MKYKPNGQVYYFLGLVSMKIVRWFSRKNWDYYLNKSLGEDCSFYEIFGIEYSWITSHTLLNIKINYVNNFSYFVIIKVLEIVRLKILCENKINNQLYSNARGFFKFTQIKKAILSLINYKVQHKIYAYKAYFKYINRIPFNINLV